MFDIGWTELAIVALIALLVIGPKELPATMRMIAGWIGKIRGLAREFQSGLDDMMRETELDKLKEQAQGVMHGDLDGMVENTIDPDGKIRDEFDYGAGYEPFSDFDEPEPETKPAAKTAKKAEKPEAGAAAAKSKKTQSTKAKSTKTKSTKAATSKTKTSGTTAAKLRAKPAAKSAATKSAANGAAKTPAKPRAKAGTKTAAKKTAAAKPATAAKPDTSGAPESDS
jgi:sec-independent protein translocase protein TatB